MTDFMATTDDFRRLALTPEGLEGQPHMGDANFRVNGRIIATLAGVLRTAWKLRVDKNARAGRRRARSRR